MGFFQDYMEGVAMRKNPQLLQQKIAGIEASKMAEMAEQIYGSRGTPANYQQQFDEVSGPMQPGQTRGYQRVNVLNPGENERSEAIQGLNNISGMMGQQQNAMQGGLNYGGQMQNLGMGSFAPYMMPWQAANQYAGTIGSPTILGSGSMTGSSDSKSMQGGMG